MVVTSLLWSIFSSFYLWCLCSFFFFFFMFFLFFFYPMSKLYNYYLSIPCLFLSHFFFLLYFYFCFYLFIIFLGGFGLFRSFSFLLRFIFSFSSLRYLIRLYLFNFIVCMFFIDWLLNFYFAYSFVFRFVFIPFVVRFYVFQCLLFKTAYGYYLLESGIIP